MLLEPDGAVLRLVEHERVAVELDQVGRQERPHELPYGSPERVLAAGKGVLELAGHASFAAERLGARHAVWGSGRRRPPSGRRVGRFLVAARVRRGRVAVRRRRSRRCGEARSGWCPRWAVGARGRSSRAVGDHFAVVGGEQAAHDRLDGLQLVGGGVQSMSLAAMSPPRPRLLRSHESSFRKARRRESR
jgi:hypothetical protein